MKTDKNKPPISEGDVETRSIERRTFLGRFGIAAGLVGIVGWTTGCESSSDSVDADFGDTGDPVDADPSDSVDSDFGDPTDTGDPADTD
jgi:hypothetical protein